MLKPRFLNKEHRGFFKFSSCTSTITLMSLFKVKVLIAPFNTSYSAPSTSILIQSTFFKPRFDTRESNVIVSTFIRFPDNTLVREAAP